MSHTIGVEGYPLEKGSTITSFKTGGTTSSCKEAFNHHTTQIHTTPGIPDQPGGVRVCVAELIAIRTLSNSSHQPAPENSSQIIGLSHFQGILPSQTKHVVHPSSALKHHLVPTYLGCAHRLQCCYSGVPFPLRRLLPWRMPLWYLERGGWSFGSEEGLHHAGPCKALHLASWLILTIN